MAPLKIDIEEYLEEDESSPFARWFNNVAQDVATRVTNALYKMEHGIFSHAKSLKDGIYEYKIDFGPGYRIYFGQEGEALILLGGGSKKNQNKDIQLAKARWKQYKARKVESKKRGQNGIN
jgi:putative addiction module killer protein